MAQIIRIGSTLYRICPSDPSKIECSLNNGLFWSIRYHGGYNVGVFMDLDVDRSDIIGYTDKGVFRGKPGYTTFLRDLDK